MIEEKRTIQSSSMCIEVGAGEHEALAGARDPGAELTLGRLTLGANRLARKVEAGGPRRQPLHAVRRIQDDQHVRFVGRARRQRRCQRSSDRGLKEHRGADRAPDGRIWIAGGNGSLLESHDGGAHFSLVETGRKDDFAGVLALDARTVVLVGDHGPFVLHPGTAREGH
mgnify:CR=1 FL=1